MNKDILTALKLIVKNLDSANEETLQVHLICVRDLLDSLLIDMTKDLKCPHPMESRKNLTCMGDKEKTEKCLLCGEMIISKNE